MSADLQLAIVALAAVAAGLYTARRVLREFQRPDDEPSACQSCPAHRTGRARLQRRRDAR